jgi:hypothetical protein
MPLTLTFLPLNTNITGVFDHYKYTNAHRSHHLTNTLTLTNTLFHKLIKYPKFSFLSNDITINFDPTDEGNYTTEELSGSKFANQFLSKSGSN